MNKINLKNILYEICIMRLLSEKNKVSFDIISFVTDVYFFIACQHFI